MVGRPGRRLPAASTAAVFALVALAAIAAPATVAVRSALGAIPREDLQSVAAWRAEAREAELRAQPPPAHRSLPQKFLIGGVHVYREVLSSQDASRCPFAPSCSHFGEEAVARAGFFKGFLLASDRLQRCHPFASRYYLAAPGGNRLDDPVDAHLHHGAGAEPTERPGVNPTVAMLMSAVVPGSGKVAAGRTWDGISSAMAVGIPAYFSWRGFEKDGVSSARGWTLGTIALSFHLGNIWGSGEAARHPRPSAAPPTPPARRTWWASGSWPRGGLADSTSAVDESARAYDAALRAYAEERYEVSTAAFLDLAATAPDSATASRARFFQCLSHAGQYQWGAARRAGSLFLEGGAGEDSTAMCVGLDVLDRAASRGRLSSGRARLYSALLPGAGQLYARNPRRAFFAALVTGAFGYYAYRVADRGAEGELLLIALPAFLRYYRGNIRGAGDCAVAANLRRDREALARFNVAVGAGE